MVELPGGRGSGYVEAGHQESQVCQGAVSALSACWQKGYIDKWYEHARADLGRPRSPGRARN